MNASTYVEMQVTVAPPSGAQFESFFDAVADALHEIADDSSRDLAYDATSVSLTFCFTFEGQVAPERAMARALTMGRTAFHAAGGATPNWDLAQWSIVPEQPTPEELLLR